MATAWFEVKVNVWLKEEFVCWRKVLKMCRITLFVTTGTHSRAISLSLSLSLWYITHLCQDSNLIECCWLFRSIQKSRAHPELPSQLTILCDLFKYSLMFPCLIAPCTIFCTLSDSNVLYSLELIWSLQPDIYAGCKGNKCYRFNSHRGRLKGPIYI